MTPNLSVGMIAPQSRFDGRLAADRVTASW
jgi:hypothetical protein